MSKIIIEEIFPDYLYSVRYDDRKENEYYRLFKEWNDKDFLLGFFRDHAQYLNKAIWNELRNDPEASAASAIEDANELEPLIRQLCVNTAKGVTPDLDSLFFPLDGKYSYVWSKIPMKAYGVKSHSFIRMYAIKLESNVYLIVCGGIKLGKTIQDSPCLKDFVIQNIDMALRYLKENGIIDGEDLQKDMNYEL